MLLATVKGICMFDCSTGTEMWRKNLDHSIFASSKIVLSDSLCAILHVKVNWVDNSNTYAYGDFALLLVETKTGRQLHSDVHWDFKIHFNGNPLPEMVANSEFLCALSTHSCDLIEIFGYGAPNGVLAYKEESNNTFVCAKYESGVCKVRKVNTSLETVLAARCREARLTTTAKKRQIR